MTFTEEDMVNIKIVAERMAKYDEADLVANFLTMVMAPEPELLMRWSLESYYLMRKAQEKA